MNDGHATQQNQPARQLPGQAAQQPVSLDDYFDLLDAAFSTLTPDGSAANPHTVQAGEDWIGNPLVAAVPEPPPPPTRFAAAAAQRPQREPLITPQAGPPPVQAAWEPPVVVAAPPPPPPLPAPAARPRPAPPPVAARPAPAPPAPSAANPFAELSAAKAEAAARPIAPVITDKVIEEVVALVLQRLTDRVVRETVTAMVSKTAEHLVQEEILRIKTEGQ